MPPPRPRRPLEDVIRLKAEIVRRVGEGEPVRATTVGLGLPLQQAQNWANGDPLFRADLSRAVTMGRFRRHGAIDDAKMAAFLARVRGGERVAGLWGKPGMPGRTQYFAWKAASGVFAEEMWRIRRGQMAALSQRCKDRYRPYEAALAERIYARLWMRGSMAAALADDDEMPSLNVVLRWRREQPAFDAMIRMAMTAWRSRHARTRRPRRACTPEVIDAMIEHVVAGGTLASAAREPGMPAAVTMYLWMKTRPEFAEAVNWAYDVREEGGLADLMGPIDGPGPEPKDREKLRDRLTSLKAGRTRRPGRVRSAA